MLTLHTLSVAVICLAVLASPSAAQERPTSTRAALAEVMILGTYHFANPGLDVVKTDVADVLSREKQNQIREVVEALARFRPTKIAVEALPSSAARLDSLYNAYRSGQHALSRNEVEQLGFRLAADLGHPRVHPVDHGGEFPFGAVMQYAQEHDAAFAREAMQMIDELTAKSNRRHRELTLAQHLRLLNNPEELVREHGAGYLRAAAVGAGDTFVGADLVSAWYDRNIRIFANLQRIAQPGERILFIVGSGHAAILRELIFAAPGTVLVEANDFLPAAAGRNDLF